MAHDKKVNLGVDDFCKHCKICAENCPSGAISFGEKQVVRGVERYSFKAEACFKIWNETGTDCGVCIGSCPYSKPPSLQHAFGLWLAARGGKFPIIMMDPDYPVGEAYPVGFVRRSRKISAADKEKIMWKTRLNF